MKFTRKKPTIIHGNNARIHFRFQFDGHYNLQRVEKKVEIDKTGDRDYRTAIDWKEVHINKVPDEIKEDLSDMFITMAEEI